MPSGYSLYSFCRYTAFGSVAKGRSFSSQSYRYGFNGQEKDNEVSGEGNDYDFGNRIYDSRLGRWLSLDPLQKKYPGISPYCYSNDNPISFADPDGRDPRVAIIIETHPEKNEFNDHVKGLEAAGYTVIKVKTGEELLNALKTNSSKDSPIKDLVIISHASNSGFFGEGGKDNGFYSPSGLEETASTTKTMEYLSKPEATSDMAKAIEFVESKEFKTNVVDPYQIEMRGKGARTTDDLKKMIDNGEINLDEKAKEIVLGGCNTVSVGKENKAYPTIATSIATATNKEVIGSSKSTSPVHHTTQRNGKWNKVSADGTKATPIGGGTKLDLTTKKVTP